MKHYIVIVEKKLKVLLLKKGFDFDSWYNKYMDIQQEINFAIKGEFEKREIEFAFPTQTVYLAK